MAKILALGCFHGVFPKKLEIIAKECDLILSTGDFGGSDKVRNIIFSNFNSGKEWHKVVGRKRAKQLLLKDYHSEIKILQRLQSIGVPIYFVDGNWDFDYAKKHDTIFGFKIKNPLNSLKKKRNLTFLRRKIKNFKKIRIYGFGGVVTASAFMSNASGFSKNKIDAYKQYYAEDRKNLFKIKDKNIDILLTHYPPAGHFDVVRYKGKNPMNGKHVGFRGYNDYMNKYNPRLLICGHMHEYQGIKKCGKTTIISIGPAFDGKAALINYPEDKNGKIIVKLIR